MWQPIETCPRDGKPFLAAATLVIDEYDEDLALIATGKVIQEPVLCYWLEFPGVSGGVMEWRRGSIVRNRVFTHWHPLPELPKP